MINSANSKPLSDLFSAENSIEYFIPKYQREYVWGKHNWELIFDDIWENESKHFLGSIICINIKKDATENDRLELIDGQQRVTTLNILFLALYEHLSSFVNEIEDEDDLEDFKADLRNLKFKIILRSDKKTPRLEPSVSGNNKADFQHLFSHETEILKNKFGKSPAAGNRRIVKSFRYFLERLKETKEINGEEIATYGMKESLQLLEKINSALMVKIEVDNHSNAFTLFETLNNRGVPLSPLDLIKNTFLGMSDEDSVDDNFDSWNRMIKNLTDEYKVQERFLRHFYHAYKNEPDVFIKGYTRATRSNIINIYETLIKKGHLDFFNKLYASSEVYNQLLDFKHEGVSTAVGRSIRDLENIGGASSYTLLLYVFEKYNLTDGEKCSLIEFLVKFFLRRNITDTPPTRDLDYIFIDIVKALHDNKGYNFEIITAKILSLSTYASDDLLKQKLEGKLYEDNTAVTRFILCKIEDLHNTTRETYVDLWQKEKVTYTWTIEHIFPQGKNIPQSWVDMIANGDTQKAKEIQEKYVHTLGNLTLSGYNSQLSNFDFKKKRDRTNKEGSFVGFKNGMFLNESIKDVDAWTVDKIKERSTKLIELITDYLEV